MSIVELVYSFEISPNDRPISEIRTFTENYEKTNNKSSVFTYSNINQNDSLESINNGGCDDLLEIKDLNLDSNNCLTCLGSRNFVCNEDNDDESNKINEININQNNNTKICNKNKGKDIFKLIYPKEFKIFNKGGYNINIRNKIDDIMNKNKNCQLFKIPHKILIRKDNLRKKIKSRFLKSLKNRINEKLKSSGSKKSFDFLPQNFICNVSRGLNGPKLDWTLKQLYSYNFNEDKNIVFKVNPEKYLYNISILKYLENNEDISKKSNFNIFKDMTYEQIYEEYLNSKEFEMEIYSLKRKNKNDEYIKKYIKLAGELNYFFK